MNKEKDFQPHPVFYEETGIGQLKSFLEFHLPKEEPVFILTDQNTHQLCLNVLLEKIDGFFPTVEIQVPAGEEYKNIETCNKIWKSLTTHYASRNSVLINLGGGVICDMGGFAASVFKRGIRFIHVPTTLLAMTDAAIGGKNGVDQGVLKNMIGTFNQPLAVFIDPIFLKTLPKRQLCNGFAEMLKHGLISEQWYFEELVKKGPYGITEEQIRISVEIKSSVVLKDPYEKAYRKILNFGHTLGHAIESHSLENDNNPLLHGEAVIIGMIGETIISEKKGMLPLPEANKILKGLLPFTPEYNISRDIIKNIIPFLLHDKKNKSKQPSFTLLRRMGLPATDQIAEENLILKSLEKTSGILSGEIEI